MDNIFSFAVEPPKSASIWDTLKAEIGRAVRHDVATVTGKPKLDAMVLPGSKPEYYIQRAINELNDLVAEFYYWYYKPEDDRRITLDSLPDVGTIPASLKDAVNAVAVSNLEAMDEAGELPPGITPEGDARLVTANLLKYILNWQDWYWQYLQDEIIDEWYELKSIEEEIYLDDDYGDYTNITTAYTDPPYSE